MKNIEKCSLEELIAPEGFECDCGRFHSPLPLRFLALGEGVLERLEEGLTALNAKKIHIVMGENAKRVAGERIQERLYSLGKLSNVTVLGGRGKVLPNEEYAKELEDAVSPDCDFILGVGSGVINDLCKYTAHSLKLDCGIVATAPSMDGYASNSSAMELGGVKTTVYTTCPALIICDTEIMATAPAPMLSAGIGDMLAKLVSIADWRISRTVNGEYYCDAIARRMLEICAQVARDAGLIMARDTAAITTLAEGLILSGVFSSFAGVSRPASGMEHTVSHLLEMFALAKGREPGSHGIQVGYGLRLALGLYEKAGSFRPTWEHFETAHAAFDEERWEKEMRLTFGEQAESLIAGAKSEGRNDYESCARRSSRAVDHWSEIKAVIDETLERAPAVLEALDIAGIPRIRTPEDMGYSLEETANALKFSRDLRSRYIFTSLCWDVGLFTYENFEELFNSVCV